MSVVEIERNIAYLEDVFLNTYDEESARAVLQKLRQLDQLLEQVIKG